jgi:hypothetical protein
MELGGVVRKIMPIETIIEFVLIMSVMELGGVVRKIMPIVLILMSVMELGVGGVVRRMIIMFNISIGDDNVILRPRSKGTGLKDGTVTVVIIIHFVF